VIPRLLRWLEWPIQIFLWIALLAGFLMMLHVSADVTGRFFFSRPLDGTTEIVANYYMVIVAYLPWAYIARNDNHISVDIFTRLMPRKAAHGLDIFVKILVIAYLGLFVWQTGSQAISQTRIHEVAQAGTMFLPIWPSRWIPPIACGLMILTLVLKIIGGIMHGPRPAEPHPEREPV
jgi:TRAP-type C4-dicarboxylate transport system permease small subunit